MYLLFLMTFKKYFIYFYKEGKGGRKKGDKHLCVGETSIYYLSYTRQQGTGPATRACVLTENRTSNLSLCGMTLNQLSRASQGPYDFLNNIFSLAYLL